jgi:hypothetical protein
LQFRFFGIAGRGCSANFKHREGSQVAKIIVTVSEVQGEGKQGINFRVDRETDDSDTQQVTGVAGVLLQGVNATLQGLVKLMEGESQLEAIVKNRLGPQKVEVPRIVLPPTFDPKKMQ